MKLDLMVFSAHPDDAEVACGGIVLRHTITGKAVGFVDLTRGELGTRGTPAIRQQEAASAADILGLQMRLNLGFADAFFRNDETHQHRVIELIRQYQPDVLLINSLTDRHPDHRRAAELVLDAGYYAGLEGIRTHTAGGVSQPAWAPKAIYHYIQDWWLKPDILIDVTFVQEQKIKAVKAFRSQFYDPESTEPQTCISDPDFFSRINARARVFGEAIGVRYAEGLQLSRYTPVHTAGSSVLSGIL